MVSPIANVLFCCFVLNSPLLTPPPHPASSFSSRSYNRRHYPAGRVHGDHCSFSQSLANIINNRSPSLSLHLCRLLPLHLSLGCTVGSDYCRSIVEERGGGERQRARERGGGKEWGECTSPMRPRIAKSPAFIAETSHVRHKNTDTDILRP